MLQKDIIKRRCKTPQQDGFQRMGVCVFVRVVEQTVWEREREIVQAWVGVGERRRVFLCQ